MILGSPKTPLLVSFHSLISMFRQRLNSFSRWTLACFTKAALLRPSLFLLCSFSTSRYSLSSLYKPSIFSLFIELIFSHTESTEFSMYSTSCGHLSGKSSLTNKQAMSSHWLKILNGRVFKEFVPGSGRIFWNKDDIHCSLIFSRNSMLVNTTGFCVGLLIALLMFLVTEFLRHKIACNCCWPSNSFTISKRSK